VANVYCVFFQKKQLNISTKWLSEKTLCIPYSLCNTRYLFHVEFKKYWRHT